jgi:hypothetical protein
LKNARDSRTKGGNLYWGVGSSPEKKAREENSGEAPGQIDSAGFEMGITRERRNELTLARVWWCGGKEV